MEDFNLETVSKKSVGGFFALTSRTFLIKILSVITSFVLTIYLSKENYGIYFIASSLVTFLVYFQDIGLAASLIQKKDSPTQEELKTTFTVQQVLVLIVVIPCLLFSKKITGFYHMDNSGLYLFDALVISFLLSSLKTIPTVLLERNLQFHKLVIPDIVENVVYNGCLLIFAIMGFGITSFTIAVLVRSIIGLFVIYYIQPWRVGISFHISAFTQLAKYGLPFQANSLLALLKDNLINLYIGKVLPFDQVGSIGFAQKLSFLPSNLVMDNVIRITFPAYSRLQHDKEALKKIVEQSLFLVASCIYPMVVGFIFFSAAFITYVPIHSYSRWHSAVFSILFFSLNILFASITVPITNFLNAIGKVKITLYSMIFLTILTWILTPFLIKIYGYNGVSIASFLVAASLLIIYPFARMYVQFSFFRPILKPTVAAIVMAIVALFLQHFITNFYLLIGIAFFASVIYFGTLTLLAKNEFKSALLYIKEARKK